MTLQVSAVTFSYGSIAALEDVTFDIGPGVTALLGVNGAGKSTLLSICAGLLSPGAGTVKISSRSLYVRKERRAALHSVSLMPQSADFPSNLTPLDVVVYAGWLKGLSGRELRSRAHECLRAVDLESVSSRRCGALSGGMKRRVALAQALVSQPDVILLDEPTTGLDPEQRRAVVDLVRNIGGTVLLSSHIVEDVENLADRVIVIDAGRIVFNGDKAGLVEGLSDDGGRSKIETGFLRAIGRGAST